MKELKNRILSIVYFKNKKVISFKKVSLYFYYTGNIGWRWWRKYDIMERKLTLHIFSIKSFIRHWILESLKKKKKYNYVSMITRDTETAVYWYEAPGVGD